jgi:heme exporter protein D
MEWQIILAVVLGIPIILIPVVLIWYINVSGIYTVIRETQKRRAARKKRMREAQELAKEPAIR